ncbi:MAG: hypothetical protein ACREUG_01240, partial [Steroidobacteraceae bacterium]
MSRAEILALIEKTTREIVQGLDGHVFRETDRLAELGANSVDRTEIVMHVQESLSLLVPRVELFGP